MLGLAQRIKFPLAAAYSSSWQQICLHVLDFDVP